MRWNTVYGYTVSANTLAGSSGPYITSETLCPTDYSSDTLGMSNSTLRWSASYVTNTYTAALKPIDSTNTKITSSASIVPDSNGSFDLGSVDSNCAWNDLYIKRLCSSNATYSISSYSSIVPSTTSTFALGSSDYIWSSVYTNDVYTNYLYSNSNGTIYCISNLYPSSNGTKNLGASTNKWASSYVTSSYTNNLYPITSGGSIKSYASILPGNTNSYSLGSLSYRWSSVYASDLYACYDGTHYAYLSASISGGCFTNYISGNIYDAFLPITTGRLVVTSSSSTSDSAVQYLQKAANGDTSVPTDWQGVIGLYFTTGSFTLANQNWKGFVRYGTFSNAGNATNSVTFGSAMTGYATNGSKYTCSSPTVVVTDGPNMSSSPAYMNSFHIVSTSSTGFSCYCTNTETGTLYYIAIGVA